MPELKDVMESQAPLQWLQPGVLLSPVDIAAVPTGAIFKALLPNWPRLCYKDDAGVVFKIRMQPV